MIKIYRKKPVEVQTVLFEDTEESILEVFKFISGQDADNKEKLIKTVRDNNGYKIYTLEGPMHASFGDIIIRGVNGEHYACKPDIFEKTYELV